MRPLRSNPYRRVAGRETKTWLPDDAGKFTGRNIIGLKWNGPQLAAVTLPDGRAVSIKRALGEGVASKGYMGEDGWVYLLTHDDAVKDMLAALHEWAKDEPWDVHLPWIEAVGIAMPRAPLVHLKKRMTRGHDHYTVYRAPLYDAPGRASLDTLEELQAIMAKVGGPPTRSWCSFRPEAVAAEFARRHPTWPLAKALSTTIEFAKRFTVEPWPVRLDLHEGNIAEDPEGNLVLLDPVYFG